MENETEQGQEIEKRNKGINWKFFISIIMVIIIIIFIIILYSNIIDYISTYEKKEVYVGVIVGNSLGISINGTALIYGTLAPGGRAYKDINFENNYKHDVRFKIFSEGDIKDFLIISENNFILKPNENKTVTFTLKVPIKTELGNYTGKVIIFVKNPSIK